MAQENYYVYLLINDNDHTYIGTTNDLSKRLDSHINKKGAKATRKSNSWKYYKIYGLFTRPTALRFEWYCKHEKSITTNKWKRVKSGIENKLKNINKLLENNEWKNIKEYHFK